MADVVYPSVPVGQAKPASRNLTTNDKFVLVDDNHDGIVDAVKVILYDQAAVDAAAEEAKFHPYSRAIDAAKAAAAKANAGKSAVEIQAAENVAANQVTDNWKGAVPPVSAAYTNAQAEAAKVAAQAAIDQAALNAEQDRLNAIG